MKITRKSEEKIVFSAKIGESLANAIRRSVSEIPILAVDEVEIFKNDSALYDEAIAHRIGLIPLKMDKITIKEVAKNPIKLKLVAEGPGFVKAKELKGNIKPAFGEIPITYLNEKQKIELIAYVSPGKAIEHSKYSPGFLSYRNVMEVEIEKHAKIEKELEEIREDPSKIGKKIEVREPEECDKWEVFAEKLAEKGKKNLVQINPKDELVFEIESFGQIPASEIFQKAIEELKKNLIEFKSAIK